MAVLKFGRKGNLAQVTCHPHWNDHQTEQPELQVTDGIRRQGDAVSVAIAHVAHLRRSGAGITEAMNAIGQWPKSSAQSPTAGWDDVVWAYALAFEKVRKS